MGWGPHRARPRSPPAQAVRRSGRRQARRAEGWRNAHARHVHGSRIAAAGAAAAARTGGSLLPTQWLQQREQQRPGGPDHPELAWRGRREHQQQQEQRQQQKQEQGRQQGQQQPEQPQLRAARLGAAERLQSWTVARAACARPCKKGFRP